MDKLATLLKLLPPEEVPPSVFSRARPHVTPIANRFDLDDDWREMTSTQRTERSELVRCHILSSTL